MIAVRPIVRALAPRSVAFLARPYHGSDHHQSTTMNDLPTPAGDWREEYGKKQRKYNMVLISGIATLGLTIAFIKSSGIIHFNYSRPESTD